MMPPASPALLVIAAALLVSAGRCRTVPVPASDSTPPIVKLDVYGVLEYPGENPLGLAGGGMLRRTAALNDPLTLVASAEDAESGARTLEIVAMPISQCVVLNPPAGVPFLTERSPQRILGASGPTAGASGSLPPTRLANATARIADLVQEPCPPMRRTVDEDADGRPISIVVATPTTKFCGVRFFARASNGLAASAATTTLLLVVGPANSGAFPCPEVPF